MPPERWTGPTALRGMARYHRWAQNVLAGTVRRVDEDDYRRDLDLFFESLHGTLNHILLVDRLWYARCTGGDFSPDGLDEELETDRERLLEKIDDACRRWIDHVDELDEERLSAPLIYHNTRGVRRELERGFALLHVFNHGTHHRGQISAGLTRLGHEAPAMDLLYDRRERRAKP